MSSAYGVTGGHTKFGFTSVTSRVVMLLYGT
jgi:hypothetical protein